MSEPRDRLAMFLRAKYPVHFYPGHPTEMLPRTDGEAVEFSLQDAAAILEVVGAAGGGAPSGQNAAAILERSRTVYWDAPKGPVREIIRLLGDELERRLWASRSTGSEEPARESV